MKQDIQILDEGNIINRLYKHTREFVSQFFEMLL